MSNLFKKTVILVLLFFVATAIYLVRNEEIRDDFLEKFGLASSGDFKVPETIKIDMSKIDMDKIIERSGNDKEDTSEGLVDQTAVQIEEGVEIGGFGGPLAPSQEKMSLEEISEQINEIAAQIETIRREVDILIAMNEIREEINTLAEMAGEMDVEMNYELGIVN